MSRPKLTLVTPQPTAYQTRFARGVNPFQAAKEAAEAEKTEKEEAREEAKAMCSNGYPLIRPLLLKYLATCQPPVQSVNQIKENWEVSQPGLYYHLKALRNAGIVTRKLGDARPAMRRPGVFYLTTREKELNQ